MHAVCYAMAEGRQLRGVRRQHHHLNLKLHPVDA